MAKIKIGEKEYEVKMNNRVIRNIESIFDGKSIEVIISDDQMSMTNLGNFIHPTIAEDIEFEQFLDDMLPSQYIDAGKVVGAEIVKAFTTTVKKK